MIAIACDHAAIGFKNAIVEHLKKAGKNVKDFGAYEPISCDYPDYALKVAKSVASGESKFGILVCGTGIGMSIAANKVKGIRCAHVSDAFSAKATRQHNDANVIALGERTLGLGVALELVDIFINTEFSGDDRHSRRIAKITAIEENE